MSEENWTLQEWRKAAIDRGRDSILKNTKIVELQAHIEELSNEVISLREEVASIGREKNGLQAKIKRMEDANITDCIDCPYDACVQAWKAEQAIEREVTDETC